MSKHFFIVGAQRSGTTYLYHMLDEHPEIEMAQPLRPEPKFFLQNELYAQGLAYYESHYFPGKDGAWLQGEKTTSYLEYPLVAQRLAASYPKAHILILMRDPIKRALSNYWFSHKHGLETWSLEKALMANPEERITDLEAKVSVNPFAYLRRGRYMDYIDAYDRYFPPAQIYGVLMEQILGNLSKIQAVYAYLGVDSNFRPSGLYQQINANDQYRAEELSSRLRRELADYFADANGRLADRFGFNLTKWWASCRLG